MRRILLVVLACLAVPASAQAATLHATTSTFASVFASSTGGDTILLASGSYGQFPTSANKPSPGVVVAEESGATATFGSSDFGSAVRNITIQGIEFTGPVEVTPGGSTLNLVFDGDKWGALGHGTHEGRLSMSCSSGCATNSGIVVRNSTFGPGGCSDGIQVSVSGVEIGPGNEFTGIVQGSCDPALVHVDPIQFYAGDNVNVHDNWIHGGDSGIMAPDGSTGNTIVNNVIQATNNYDIVAGNMDNSTIAHNVADADIYDGNPAIQPGCSNHNSANDVYQNNVGTLSGCGTNITADHNLTSVTFTGGSGRCGFATASPKGTASDGTDIGLNDCGAPPPNPECSDGINNDPTEDTLIDYPNDPGCSSATDNSELGNPVAAQCSDGLDNDSDGAVDFPADPGCASAADNDETDAPVDHAPVAAFSASPNPSAPSQAVTFDATGSTCQDAPCSYAWVDDPPPAGGTTFPLSGSGAPAGQWTCSPTTSGCSTLTFTFTGTGTKYVTLTVTDADGDTSTVEHDQVVSSSPPPDTTPPDTTITSAPSNGTSTSASVSFTGTDNVGVASFECRIDGGSFAVCVSPKSYSGLSVGSHTVDVRAKDAAGNVDATPATATWTISSPADTTPPDTSITTAPSNGTSTSASIPFAGTDNVGVDHFECKLDAAAYATCTSPKAYSGLSVGSHTFSVRAYDAAGNVDATPASATWTVSAPGVTPPTFLAEREMLWNTSATKSGTALPVQAGDVLVTYAMAEDNAQLAISATGGLTWVSKATWSGGSTTSAITAWVSTVPAGVTTTTVTITRTATGSAGSGGWFGADTLQFRGSSGVGAAASCHTGGAGCSTNPGVSLPTQDHSAIVKAVVDWNAKDGAGRASLVTGVGTFSEASYFRDAARYTTYGGFHSDAGTAGSKTVGYSAPTGQSYSIVAVEVKGT